MDERGDFPDLSHVEDPVKPVARDEVHDAPCGMRIRME